MLSYEMKAYFKKRPMAFEQGVAEITDLLLRLQNIDGFTGGWRIAEEPLTDDIDQTASQLKALKVETGEISDFFFFVAQSPPRGFGMHPSRPEYLASLRFDRVSGHLTLKLSLYPDLAALSRVHALVLEVGSWWPLQHLSFGERFYEQEDSPIDVKNRQGIGWIGWVPFSLSETDIPEAAILTPAHNGTLIASQDSIWAVTDRDAVKRAQDLELRLNGMGLLPTRTVLREGTWGEV